VNPYFKSWKGNTEGIRKLRTRIDWMSPKATEDRIFYKIYNFYKRLALFVIEKMKV